MPAAQYSPRKETDGLYKIDESGPFCSIPAIATSPVDKIKNPYNDIKRKFLNLDHKKNENIIENPRPKTKKPCWAPDLKIMNIDKGICSA